MMGSAHPSPNAYNKPQKSIKSIRSIKKRITGLKTPGGKSSKTNKSFYK
jgi:hypothetical protein